MNEQPIAPKYSTLSKEPYAAAPRPVNVAAAVAMLLIGGTPTHRPIRSAPVYKSRLSLPHTYMLMARIMAEARSKDPATKVGAVLVNDETQETIFGYNGFPPGLEDATALWDNKDRASPCCKYNYVRHAELNLLNKAAAAGLDRQKCTLYCTLMPCLRCTLDSIMGSGLRRLIIGDLGYGTEEIFELIRLSGTAIGLLSPDPRSEPGYVLCDSWASLKTEFESADRPF